MSLFSIRDFSHWAAWGDLLLICKHKHYSPTRGNLVVVCNSTGAIGIVVFNGVKQGGVDVAWTLKFCFCGVTHEWVSSVFEVFFLFWISVLSLLSRWYEMNACVKLLSDNVWAAVEDKTGFLSVGVDIFDRFYLKEQPISLPMMTMSNIKRKYEK